MSTNFNGTSLSNIIYNGVSLAKVTLNGIIVWVKSVVQTFTNNNWYGGKDGAQYQYWSTSFDTAVNAKSITVTLKGKHGESIGNTIYFYLQGSNDNSSWTQLYYYTGSGEDDTWLTFLNGTYTLPSGKYKYFRIMIAGRRSFEIQLSGSITFEY